MRIKKTTETTPYGGAVVNTKNNSTNNTYSCDYVNNLHTYSTTEQRIGTWINNKPVYRKVVVYNNTGISSSVTLQTNITNGNEVVKFSGEFIDTSSGTTMPYPTLNSAGTAFLQCLISNDASTIYFRGTDSWGANTTRTHKFIIEYTKTTD